MSAAAIADPRASAWRAAVRHSRRVGALRLAVPAAAVALIVAPLALRLLAPATADAPPGPIAPGFVGDAMTMAAPKLSGYGRDGKRFALDARSATQRPDAPGKVGLDGVDARLIAADGAATVVDAPSGLYDGATKALDLAGPVHVANPDYAIDADGARVDFVGNAVASDGGATLNLKAGTIAADRLRTRADGGVTLVGRVRSSFATADGADSTR